MQPRGRVFVAMRDGRVLGHGSGVIHWTLGCCSLSSSGLVVKQRTGRTDWQLTGSSRQHDLLDGIFWQQNKTKKNTCHVIQMMG